MDSESVKAQQETRRETEIEKLIVHRSWRKYTAHTEGPHGEVKTEDRQDRAIGSGAHAFTKVHEWSALELQA